MKIADKYRELPASQIADAVNEALSEHGGAVITAPPGAGKSTLLPLTILEAMNHAVSSAGSGSEEVPGKILMLEPRRIAARQIAERMADMLGEETGKTVGYRVRFEKRVSDTTRIEVLTEGILTRMLTNDATLDGVGVVIFDEFHERSINTDLALTLTRLTRDVIRPDLKIVIMSATIDADNICNMLHLPLIESAGKMFPVEVRYIDDVLCERHNVTQEIGSGSVRDTAAVVASVVRKAHSENDGSILAFLPGQGEIQRCTELLEGTLGDTCVYPLYGNLSAAQQRKAISPMKDGGRKVVLATPIAETSLTIEGIRIVVDSGLHRKLVFDSRTGLSHLVNMRISRDMAMQRTGRAGRLTEGVCYRLWTKISENRMDEHRTPEILEADLAPVMLDIAAFGETDMEALPWMTIPERDSIYRAKALLQRLGAIDDTGVITDMGRKMSVMPCHPRISRMILRAENDTQKALACDIAAVLGEKDPMFDNPDTDISLRISALRKSRALVRTKGIYAGNEGRWSSIARVAEEYRRTLPGNALKARVYDEDVAPEYVGALIAYAYPERIAKAWDDNGGFRLASGDNVRVDISDSISAKQWIVIASANLSSHTNGRVFLAAPLDINDVRDLITERDNVSWDSKELMVHAQHERRIGKLLIDSKPLFDVDKEDIIRIVCEATKKDGLSMFDWNEDVQRLQRRVAQVAAWHPELEMPDFTTEHLMEVAHEWLPFYLEQNGKIASTVTELKKINLCEVLTGILMTLNIGGERGDVLLDRYAPSHVRVPTGSRIRIDYRIGSDAPVLSVRLQECFGLEETPKVNDGKQPLLMELLSPGFKPVQLTQDLRSFWSGTYFDVRKELKRRYPKHYWPENPLEAEAVRGVKKKDS